MNSEFPWFRIMLMLGFLAVMFGFPIITLTIDGRRARRRELEDGEDSATGNGGLSDVHVGDD